MITVVYKAVVRGKVVEIEVQKVRNSFMCPICSKVLSAQQFPIHMKKQHHILLIAPIGVKEEFARTGGVMGRLDDWMGR